MKRKTGFSAYLFCKTCQECGQEIKWLDSDSTNGNKEDDQFSSVYDKLKWHKQNDKMCVRNRKLKKLGV